MASTEEKVQSIHAAISSLSPENVATLNELLLPKDPLPKATKQKSAAASRGKIQVNPGKKTKGLTCNTSLRNHEISDRLTVKQRSTLATEVINASLKILSQAIKATTFSPNQRQNPKEITSAVKESNASRLNSLHQSPLQPRRLSKAASSPSISAKASRSSNASSISNSEYRSTAECARISFACLRILQASNTQDVNLPPLQLESGMSILVGKLISLGMHDLATKELRILKRRLVLSDMKRVDAAKDTLANLIDFGESTFTGTRLGLVITTQLQTLRIITMSKNPRYFESVLTFLRSNSLSSPARLLLAASESTEEPKQREKIARQMQSLSETLLSLCPSISLSDDTLTTDLRRAVSPTHAIQIQSLALHYRYLWWDFAGHKGDMIIEILEPFFRCLSAFARRSKASSSETYFTAVEAFNSLKQITANRFLPSEVSRSVMVGIYNTLASLAKNNHQIDVAIKWTDQTYQLIKASKVSEAKLLSAIARLVSLQLQSSTRRPEEEEQLLILLDNLQCPFKGETSEIEELLVDLSYARKAALSFLCQRHVSPEISANANDGLFQMCESLVFLYPRLSLRYLGNQPNQNTNSKELARYEHRKYFISKLSIHAIDSALFVVKAKLSEGKSTWEILDSRLQDCTSLVNCIDFQFSDRSTQNKELTPKSSYRVKISNLYYSLFLNMMKKVDSPKDIKLIRVLRRSIASVQNGSSDEKKAAFLMTKLERLAELCKDAGRYDELFKTLCILRDEMIADGVLSLVTKRAASRSLKDVWSDTRETAMLGRTIHAIVKAQLKHAKSIAQVSLVNESWPIEDRSIILEHQLEYLCRQPTSNQKIINELQIIAFQELLCLYDRSRYPIRRIRVLLRLSMMSLSHESEELRTARCELDQQLIENQSVKDTEDEGLFNYLTHYKTMSKASREIDKAKPCLEIIKEVLTAWSSLSRSSRSLVELNSQIDDAPGLLTFLQTLAEWLQVRGFDRTRLEALQLIIDINLICDTIFNPDELVINFLNLGTQWLRLGYSGQAKLALDRAKNYLQRSGISSYTKLQFYLSLCEYSLAGGNLNEAECNLASAQTYYTEARKYLSLSKSESSLEQRIKTKLLVSNIYDLHSKLALEYGFSQSALDFAKCSVRLLRRAWVNIEHAIKHEEKLLRPTSQLEVQSSTENPFEVDFGSSSDSSSSRNFPDQLNFWPIIGPLFRSLSHLSLLFAHHGIFQETLYYAEQSYKLAKQMNSDNYLAIAGTTLGSIWLRGGDMKKCSDLLREAKTLLSDSQKSMNSAVLAYNFGKMHGVLGDHESEIMAYNEAATILSCLLSENSLTSSVSQNVEPEDDLVKQMSQLRLEKKAVVPRRTTRAATRGKLVNRVKNPDDVNLSLAEDSPYILGFQLSILREKERVEVLQRRCVDVPKIFDKAEVKLSPTDMVNHSIILARLLLLHSLEQINTDPVYSILPDSTISFPAILGTTTKHDRSIDKVLSPQRKAIATRSGNEYVNSRNTSADSFKNLRRAQDSLRDSLSVALTVSPTAAVYKITNLLNSIAMLLSTAGRIKGRPIVHPGFSSLVVETARNLILRREREAILTDSHFNLNIDESSWPQFDNVEAKKSCHRLSDENLNRFGREYIDIIPKQWTVISISLSECHHELSLTKLQAGNSPFILRLPLGRNNSIDADEKVLGYEQGRAELLEIMQLANKTAHDSRNRLEREARLLWWKEREALDKRLRELLENIEKVWLGGFTGIFSQHVRRPELFSRFQKTFNNILDKYLPSRQKTKKRNPAPRITLDSRILDLFIGLGDTTENGRDLSEPLTDLFYFVVDILQFHGELNAYAEIDFDMIVVETIDALRCYNDAAHASGTADPNQHTILILDKALHSFPWESLPCIDGLAVSRLPSLGCLRERLLPEQEILKENRPDGFYIDRRNGSYILNPSNDLKNTLATFQKPLESLDSWKGVVNREPSEEEFKNFLQDSDLFLYFGHGSGSQYIRSREIKKLKKCAVSMLMGCSSGALAEAGEFEPYGPAMNYMHAGSHALVATLWDVTDKDIDRFAERTLEHWGLYRRLTNPAKENGKKNVENQEIMHSCSLIEAVVEGKKSCNLRYLNAAAVCVYGIPVYLNN
ncbi:Separin [Podosphaera aphanis]|nr:Separin [Podosphaera aphanis]